MLSEVLRAKEAFWEWKTTPLENRIAIARAFAREVEKADDLPSLISEEVGKPLWESRHEVDAMVGKVALSIHALLERAGTYHKQGIMLHHLPHGVLGVLGPFNLPGHLPNGHITPALLAGNTVVFKPSEYTPKVGVKMLELWQRAGLPEGVLQLVFGGAETGDQLAKDPNLDGLLFTGSVNVGLTLSEYYGKRPEKILALEMGGNNPLIVGAIRHIQPAVLTTLESAYATSGQRCTAARRLILINSPSSEAFLEAFCASLNKVRIGKYTDTPEPFMGPLIHAKAAEKVMRFQERLLKQGAHSLHACTLFDKCFVTPGLIDVTALKEKPDEECFGPLLQLIRVPTLEEAVVEANRTRFGLSAALFCDDESAYTYAVDRIRVGVFNWNAATTGASSAAPFGGVGLSGNHRPSGYYACDFCAYPMVSRQLRKPRLTLAPGLAE